MRNENSGLHYIKVILGYFNIFFGELKTY